jgi:hypothetical protein
MSAQEHERQPFLDLVPNQFVVLYGIKSLAIKNINEFLYGVRARGALPQGREERALRQSACRGRRAVDRARAPADAVLARRVAWGTL